MAASTPTAAATGLSSCGSLVRPRGHIVSRPPPRHPRRTGQRFSPQHRPDCVAIENIFHARNVRSALKLGHARGVALLAASEAGVADRRVRADRGQARGRRLRPRGKTPGRADGQAAARSRRRSVAARRGGRAGGGDLPHPQRQTTRARYGAPSRHLPCAAGGTIERDVLLADRTPLRPASPGRRWWPARFMMES